MPLYEYKCAACSHRFERLEKMSAPTVQACPDCGQPSHRQIGAPALQFKGSGWYVTDYGKKGSNGDSSRSSAAAAGASTSESKTESTSTTASTTKSESSGGDSKDGSGSGDSSKHQAA